MIDMAQHEPAAVVRSILRAYHAAMVAADTGHLDTLVTPDYSLVHITGYVQPKQEWFGVIRSGAFDYHRIDVDGGQVAVTIDGNAATVTGRGIFDATIDGMHAPWRLRFSMRFEKHEGAWKIRSARYNSY